MKKDKFCEYVVIYEKDLYIIASAILKNEADAQDAVSSAILKAYENLGQLRSSRKFKPWMLAITKNEALKIKKKRLQLPGDDVVEALLKPVSDQYDELWDVKEEYRLVVVLFYYDGLSLRDISEVLNVPLGTVKSRLSRGRDILKNALGKEEKDEKI